MSLVVTQCDVEAGLNIRHVCVHALIYASLCTMIIIFHDFQIRIFVPLDDVTHPVMCEVGATHMHCCCKCIICYQGESETKSEIVVDAYMPHCSLTKATEIILSRGRLPSNSLTMTRAIEGPYLPVCLMPTTAW